MTRIFRDIPTENEKKGIDIILKAVHKQYPFIIGWQFTDNNPLKYSTMISIDVIVDVDKLSKFYNKRLSVNFQQGTAPTKGYSFCSIFSFISMDDFDNWPCNRDYFRLKKLLNKYHKYLPKIHKFHTKITDSNGEVNPDFFGEVDIDLNYVYYVKK